MSILSYFFIELYKKFQEKFSFTHTKSVNINVYLDPDLDFAIIRLSVLAGDGAAVRNMAHSYIG